MSYLYMNASAALIIIITLVIRKVTINKVPHYVFGFLWGIAAIRMLLPFQITSNWCVYNAIFKLRDYLFVHGFITLQYNSRQLLKAINKYLDLQLVIKSLYFIWFIGVIIVATYFVLSYYSGMKLIKGARPCDIKEVVRIKQWLEQYNLRTDMEIKSSNEIGVPLAYGFIRPGILIPTDFDINQEMSAKQIMLHECMHIKYWHSFIKLMLAILVSSNWFNPCAWILFKFINRDMEIACDRHVLELLGREQRESYALNLIQASQMQYKDSIVYSGFAKNSIKERIVAIMSFKKMSAFALVLSLSIPVSVATAFATTDNHVNDNQVKKLVVHDESKVETIEDAIVSVSEDDLAKSGRQEVVTRAARDLYVEDYERVTTYMSPEKLEVTFENSGCTYAGTLTIYEMQVIDGKYHGYYHGWAKKVK
ncbi:M56 family metallopeptidase [Anaerotignum sp.]|uniref:M56 family metallopeptidase n=1 Tax=Anaerotignum sp. TaxID=2039241 RepID=UPI0027151C8A|nr:M56 family metallopeptidase [Anaerotignum sp.]